MQSPLNLRAADAASVGWGSRPSESICTCQPVAVRKKTCLDQVAQRDALRREEGVEGVNRSLVVWFFVESPSSAPPRFLQPNI